MRVYAWLTVHEQHYLVMQYVSGGSLADLLKSEGPLDWQRAARYVADVGEGLLEVHARGIVHRDVKPANILWDPRRDEALLTDFGVAARLADPAAVAGSIPYMAPEAFDGRVSSVARRLQPGRDVLPPGHRLGAVPRLADLRPEAADRPGPARSRPASAGLPEPLERIIRAGLAADPGRRPGLKEFVSGLRGTLNQLLVDTFTMSHRPAGPVPSTERLAGSRAEASGGPTTEPEPPPRPAPVDLRLIVSRQVGPQTLRAGRRDPPAAAARPR